nr:hypothetical protein [Tanacetum cinerariifolium]
VLRDEVDITKSALGQVNAMIAKIKAMDDPFDLGIVSGMFDCPLLGVWLVKYVDLATWLFQKKCSRILPEKMVRQLSVDALQISSALLIALSVRYLSSHCLKVKSGYVSATIYSIGEVHDLIRNSSRISIHVGSSSDSFLAGECFSEQTVVQELLAQTTAVIAELQAMEDQDEVHDSLLAAKDAKHGEESKLLALHEVIDEALEEIESQGHNVAMLDGNNDCQAEHLLFTWIPPEFLIMANLYILDKLSDVASSSWLEDKMKFVFSRARDSNESFIELWRELCSAIRVSITKDRRLIAELEALGQRADVLKSLEYMREMVAQDFTRVGILEQLLAGTHVGMRLKAEYAADMGETV